jgi:hypothetical protein
MRRQNESAASEESIVPKAVALVLTPESKAGDPRVMCTARKGLLGTRKHAKANMQHEAESVQVLR